MQTKVPEHCSFVREFASEHQYASLALCHQSRCWSIQCRFLLESHVPLRMAKVEDLHRSERCLLVVFSFSIDGATVFWTLNFN